MLNSASAGPLVHLRYLFRYCLEARCETSVQAETWRSLLILLGPRTVSDSEVGVALCREGRVGAEALSDVRRGWGVSYRDQLLRRRHRRQRDSSRSFCGDLEVTSHPPGPVAVRISPRSESSNVSGGGHRIGLSRVTHLRSFLSFPGCSSADCPGFGAFRPRRG
ncbi:hypothetical protein [Streptomyces agglomeratus]|uniref:YxiG-like protein n=1 Tax=Streptomyces agglomeratus TaxID=285458 RepID=UPI000D1A3B5F